MTLWESRTCGHWLLTQSEAPAVHFAWGSTDSVLELGLSFLLLSDLRPRVPSQQAEGRRSIHIKRPAAHFALQNPSVWHGVHCFPDGSSAPAAFLQTQQARLVFPAPSSNDRKVPGDLKHTLHSPPPEVNTSLAQGTAS